MKRLLAIVALCLVFNIPASSLFSQPITTASDNGANYSEGWSNGSNGGTGFQAWNIWSSDGTGGSGGNFIGNPVSGGVTGMAANSFGLYAKPIGSGAGANAERSLSTALAVGQTLSFQWGINYDSGSGGNKGFNLYSGGVEILNINNAGSSAITCNGANVGFDYGTAVMTWSFTRVDSTTISISANDRDGTGAFEASVVVSSGAIDKLRFYASGMQQGDQSQPYFNNLTVTEPVATSMAVPGDHAFLDVWQPDGSNGTGMTQSSNPATPNLWTSYFKSSDARLISFKFVADGSFDFAWGADPARSGYARRGGDSIQLNIPATGLYIFSFDQSTLQYSLTRAGSADFGSYQVFSDTYNLTGDGSSDDDGDTLTNEQEYGLNTDPTNPDTDSDTLTDSEEVNTTQTNPLLADSDSDTLPDWWEFDYGLNPNFSTGDDGASGNPDGDLFTNKQEFEGQSDPSSSASVPANRAVTFSIDLSRQIAAGTFSASTSAVEVWGTFNDWGNFTNKYSLTSNGSGTYSGTYVVPGAAGSISRYKFVTFDGNNTLSWEPGSDRVLVMGANGQPISLPVAYLGEVRPVTFSVNMGVQAALGRFTHGTDKVFVAGNDVAGGWDPGTELTRVGSTDVYSGAVFVSNVEGVSSSYKFRVNNSLGYEGDVNPDPAADTRTFTLGVRDLAQVNPEVYFNNLNELPPTRTVTFAVDMGVQAFRGAFTPGTDAVYLVGDATNWTTGTAMVREGETSVYKLTLNLEGAENATLNYKFKSGNTAVGNSGFERDTDAGIPGDTPRVLTLGEPAVAQNLVTATFNNQGEARKLTLLVDMTTQIAKGNFDPASNSVSVVGNFNGFSTTADVAAPAPGVGASVYSATLVLDGPQSGNIEYKFFNNKSGAPNSGYEITRENANRTFATVGLGENLTETTVSAVPLFSNDDGVGPTLSLNGSTPVNLNVGESFTDEGATATDAQDGACMVNTTGSVNTSTPGTYTLTYTSFDVAGNTSVPASVTRTIVVAAADPLADYLGGFGLTGANAAGTADPDGDGMDNNAEYAFGTDPTSGASRQTTLISSTGVIKLLYLQRNSGISYSVKSFTDLTTSFDSGTTVTPVATSPQPADVRTGYTQYEAVLSTAGIAKGFLRVKATLGP